MWQGCKEAEEFGIRNDLLLAGDRFEAIEPLLQVFRGNRGELNEIRRECVSPRSKCAARAAGLIKDAGTPELTSDNIQLSEPTPPPNHLDERLLQPLLHRFDPKIRQFLEASIATSIRRAYQS